MHAVYKPQKIRRRSRRTYGVAALVLALSVTSVATAGAQELGADEVALKNGGSIRGTVVSVEPGTKVVILELGQTEPRTLTWAEVADVQKGKYAPAGAKDETEPGDAGPGYKSAPVEIAEEEEEEPAPEKSGPGVVRVHIEADEPVSLYERGGTSVVSVGRYVAAVTHARQVCNSPCDKTVDGSRGQGFFIAGDGIPESRVFKLSELGGDATLEVSAGSVGQRVGGYWMMILGGTALLGGAIILPVAATTASDLEISDDLMIAGGVMLGGGAGILAGGIALFVTGGTSVDVVDGPRAEVDDSAKLREPFEMDRRPVARAPRYWLGEF